MLIQTNNITNGILRATGLLLDGKTDVFLATML